MFSEKTTIAGKPAPKDSARIPFDTASLSIYLLASIIAPTWRFTPQAIDSIDNSGSEKSSAVAAFWHTNLLAGFYSLRKRSPHALVSSSRDGTRLCAVLQRWGYTLIRGSSSRNSVTSLRAAVRSLSGANILAMTPDGPRGPREIAKPGVAQIACMARVPVFALGYTCKTCWHLGSWDHFTIAAPFSRISVNATRIDPATVDYASHRAPELLEKISQAMSI